MARPLVADGENGLHMWRVAGNMLNKHSQTADDGSFSSWGVGHGLTIPSRKKNIVKRYTGPRNVDQIQDYEIGRTCGMYGIDENAYRILIGKPEEKRPFDRCVNRRVILEWILEK
jgi:hypothetical protein